MIGCMRTRVRKQPIIALYFESETVLKFYNLEARTRVKSEAQVSCKVPSEPSSSSVQVEMTVTHVRIPGRLWD